jgi:uncharacterized protein (TIGR00288 family)
MQTFINAPHRGGPGAHATSGAPNAALLIDFDNVTMGIRSDLTRQLKELLNSDIIKGKVAVQRAYADWRRYAQYIVPLSEASVDLIFAPAYGSSKKNATDIRLAIDALELVFTRPEIGTFILLSGDSDFSSLVLKLKEYGKYVIGVGLRESASDLLVQNCDEYFSYSSLTGLTRAGEEDSVTGVDPWELAERAVNQMAADGDVMRSDRLKQVMLELDPNFDEGQLGYTKFNRFLIEAAGKNRLNLRKLENGQYEVRPFDQAEPEARGEGREDRGRGRGRRDRKEESRGRESRDQRAAAPAATEPRSEPAPRREAESQPRGAERAAAKPEGRSERGMPSRSEGRRDAAPTPRDQRADGLDHAYDLLREAVRDLVSGSDAARDSDIKRKMLELEHGWDEGVLGFTKFSRFLRQAHDAEVIDLTRSSDGFYEARLPRGAGRSSPPRRDRDRDRDRGAERDRKDRGRGRSGHEPGTAEQAAAEAPGAAESRTPDEVEAPDAVQADISPEEVAAEATAARSERRRERDRERRRERAAEKAADKAAAEDQETPAVAEDDQTEAGPPWDKDAVVDEQVAGENVSSGHAVSETAPAGANTAAASPRTGRPAGFGARKGRRGPGPDGPPPVLPGQVVGSRLGVTAGAPSSPPAASEADPSQDQTIPPAEPTVEPTVAAADHGIDDVVAGPREPAAREASASSAVDAEALGLPTERGAVIRYLSNSYQGVGQKTAEALIDAFGADGVFRGLNDQPERVKEILGAGRRTEVLLNAWQRDFRRRTSAGQAAGSEAEAGRP